MTIAQRVSAVHASIETGNKAREFCSLARVIAASRGDRYEAQQICHKHRVLLGPRIQQIIESPHPVYSFAPDLIDRQTKAAVAAGTTADSGWALPLAEYDTLANAFIASLRHYGAFDSMLASGGMKRVPFRVRVGASTVGITGQTIPGSSAKPISKLSLTGGVLDEQKAVGIITMTDELMKFGSNVAGDLFAQELSAAIATETDETFCAALILNATSIPSSGITAEHFRSDLRAMLTSITTNARSRLFLLMPPAISKTLSVLHTNTGAPAFENLRFDGGEIAGIQVLATDGMPASTVLLVDGQQVACASETVTLSASSETSLQLDTSPDSPVGAATPMTSLWAMNLSALKAERYFGVSKLTTVGTCVLTSVNILGDSPGP